MFAEHGADVVLLDINKAGLDETAALAHGAGPRAIPVTCDVANVDELRSAMAIVEHTFGRLHVLFNNVGIPGAAGYDITEADWDLSIGVNLKSAFFATSLALPLLVKADGKGSIIYTSSTAGLVASPFSPLYALAKGGVISLMRSVAVASAKDGIRANALSPGLIDSPALPHFFGRTLAPGQDVQQVIADFVAANIPLNRTATTSEIAAAALFLASDDAGFITGATIPVDGGFVAR
jgi:NAD(P)-dependent dehydrogenase (short-subunit alcohol dehydrogenase family)